MSATETQELKWKQKVRRMLRSPLQVLFGQLQPKWGRRVTTQKRTELEGSIRSPVRVPLPV